MAVRRAFVDTPSGQVHIRVSGAPNRSSPPLLLLHQSPASSLTFQEILPFFGRSRRSVAIDTPGFGESFRPAAQPGIPDYARWIVEAANALAIAQFDLLGVFTGAGTASEIAAANPDRVRRLVLAGPPLFSAEQQRYFTENAWPVRPKRDGSHFAIEWNRVMSRDMPGLSFERRCDAFNEFYRGGANAIWGEQAIANYPLREVLPRIAAPTLVLKPNGIHGDCEGAAALLRDGRVESLDHLGYSMMQAAPERVSDVVTRSLDR